MQREELDSLLSGRDARQKEDKTMSKPELKATVYERGNGFPKAGAYVPGSDDKLYRVVRLSGYINTTGGNNNVGTIVELADWYDCEESEVFEASVTLDES